jgi:hypothetical protein
MHESDDGTLLLWLLLWLFDQTRFRPLGRSSRRSGDLIYLVWSSIRFATTIGFWFGRGYEVVHVLLAQQYKQPNFIPSELAD